MDKKKLLYAVIIVIVIFGIGVSYYLTARTTNSTNTPQSTSQSAVPSPASDNSAGTSQTATTGKTNPTGPTSTPEEITKTFYDWYINYPQDVIATGAYKSSPYLTENFIATIENFAKNYNPKFDPIFCTPNKTKNYAISKVMGTTDPKSRKVQITDKNIDAPKPLYDVIIVQENGVLKIDDVMCD